MTLKRDTRVRLFQLEDSPQSIREQTGFEDVVDGLEGTVMGMDRLDEDGTRWYDVRLVRAGERLLFPEHELEVVQ